MGETGGVRKKRKRKRKLALGGKSRKGKSARRGGRRKRKRQALKDNSQVLIEPGQAGGRMGENVKSNLSMFSRISLSLVLLFRCMHLFVS